MAGANGRQGGAGEDGILTALEAAGLDLRGTKLVVLSACETGVGETAVGEGVYGLRRALVLAGAESALMTLWQVSDEATRELMSDYYRKLLSGAGRTEGLRQVQLAMLRRTETSHPFFWASFIQSGAWQSVSITGGAVLPGGAQR
ncbi:MAG: CHAT domain-containing protein [Pyrinomonadaceae bacterium]